MLNRCANVCVDFLYRHHTLPNADRPIYVYGFELSLSTLFSLLTVFSVSLLAGYIGDALDFFFVFFVLRLFCGGYHAPTYFKCFLITNSVFIVKVMLTGLLLRTQAHFLLQILLFPAAFLIWKFAPVENGNHPLSEKTYRKNRTLSRALSVSYVGILLSCSFVPGFHRFFISASLAFIFVALMIVIEIVKMQTGGEKDENREQKNC